MSDEAIRCEASSRVERGIRDSSLRSERHFRVGLLRSLWSLAMTLNNPYLTTCLVNLLDKIRDNMLMKRIIAVNTNAEA